MPLEPISNFDVALAERTIEATYGDTVSVWDKAKSLLKFGHNEDLGVTLETVWEIGGDETYVTDNTITHVSSTNASDTAVVMYVEGHTVTGTGTDAKFTFVTQLVTLNGQNKVALEKPLARSSRAYAFSGTLLGDFYVFEDDTLTAGVPDTTSKIHLVVLAATSGHTQSYKSATTVSNSDYLIISSIYAAVTKKAAAFVDFEFEIREPGKTFRPFGGRICLNSQGDSTEQIHFSPHVIVPKNSDVRIRAVASNTGVEVDAAFNCYLAKVRG